MSEMPRAEPDSPSRKSVQPLRYPCSLQQLQFWAMECLDPGNTALNAAFRWRLTGNLCSRTLESAFAEIIKRHEAFRTALIEVDCEPIQVIHEDARFTMPIVDLSLLNGPDARHEADRLARLEAQTPFDLTSSPLVRAKLLTLSSQETIMLVTAHQSVSDGWSEGIWARELGEVYSALREGRAARLPPLPMTYSDFAVWQREWAKGDELAAVADSYRAKFADAPYFEVPPDKVTPETPSNASEIVSLLMDRDITAKLSTFAQKEGCTIFMAALASLLITLKWHTGESDISVGTQVAGREEVELENIVGYFANTLLLRADLSGDPTFREVLGRVREVVLAEFDNQHMPYEKLIEFLRPAPRIGHNPLYSVNFVLQRAFVESSNWANLTISSIPSVPAGGLYDLGFFMVERPEGWRLSCEFKIALFEKETAQSLIAHMAQVMKTAARQPDLEISRYPDQAKRNHAGLRKRTGIAGSPKPRNGFASRSLREREQYIADVWGEVLGNRPSSPSDDFFVLGGDFWLALRLARSLEQKTGHDFNPAEIFHHPSLEAYTAALAARIPEEDHSEIFILQAGTATPPIFTINMIMPTRFVPLVRHIEQGRPFYGAQVFDPTQAETFSSNTYEELASRYVTLIRKVQPHGPYALLGWCAGGVLAFAVAKKLEQEGEDIALLAILDVWAPGYQASLSPLRKGLVDLFDRVRLIRERIGHDWQKWRAGRIPLSEFLINCIPGRIRQRFMTGRASIVSSRQDAVDYSSQLLDYVRRLARAYDAKPVNARIHLFLSEAESRRWFLKKARGWDRFAGKGLTHTTIPGDHFSLLENPNVELMALVINAAIRQHEGVSGEKVDLC